MANHIKVGDQAPDFTLPDQDMKPLSLKDFLGQKVVLAFFVGAFTASCTKEVCEFRDSMSRIVDLKAQVIGIDLTAPFSSKRFAEKNRLPFPVLSDNKHEVFEKYGLQFSPCDNNECCFGIGCYPLVKRSIFILDGKGIVRYKWVSNASVAEPNYEEMQEVVKKIM
jgi:glutaredoxin-dependent peroxiredoxin